MYPNNYYSSLVQLKSLEKKLDKDLDLRVKYTETIDSDIAKGYVIKVDDFNLHARTAREWYLPHHPVLNPNKPGKVRRLLNGAAKFHGKSLNSCLLLDMICCRIYSMFSCALGSTLIQFLRTLKGYSFK